MWHVATTDEFDEWFAELDEDGQAELIAKVELLKLLEPKLGRPHADTLNGSKHANMKDLRAKTAGKSQQEVAETLGMKQPSLSKLEKQGDMQVSTLRKIVRALGGELEVLARFPKGTVKIDQFDPSHRRSRHQRPSGLQLV